MSTTRSKYACTQITAYTCSSRSTHNTMYAHVYTCTHYGRTGHLAKFCYDSTLNFANRFVWVRKGANPMDPMEYGYQNSLLFYLMQVWALTWRESNGALRWMRSKLHEDYLDASLSREVWWKTTMFWRQGELLLRFWWQSFTPVLFTCFPFHCL